MLAKKFQQRSHQKKENSVHRQIRLEKCIQNFRSFSSELELVGNESERPKDWNLEVFHGQVSAIKYQLCSLPKVF